jgi:hypothetical protein
MIKSCKFTEIYDQKHCVQITYVSVFTRYSGYLVHFIDIFIKYNNNTTKKYINR